MPDMKKIGNFIKKERERLNLSQDDIANKLGITRQAVSKWERGKCLPDKAIMTDLCEILEITSNELLAGERIREDNKEKIDNVGLDILITVTDYKKVDWYMYNYEDGELRYSNYNKDIKIGDSVLFDGELECEGDCSGHKERYKYYKEKYIDKIIDFK